MSKRHRSGRGNPPDTGRIDSTIEAVAHPRPDAGVIDQIHAADVSAAVEAGQYRRTPAVKLLGHLSEISDQPPAFALSLLAAAGGVLGNRPRLAEAGLRVLAALTLATAAKSAIKSTVVRTRPFMLLDHGEYEAGLDGPDDGPWNSFPSGHTANAVAAARAVARTEPQWAVPLTIGAAAIGAIQVPRGAHHPLDVIAGAALGWAAEALTHRLAPARPAERSPATGSRSKGRAVTARANAPSGRS